MKFLELSHQMEPGKEEYLLDIKTYQIEELYPQYNRRPGDWYILQKLHLNVHVGTHIESPYHHRKDGHDISQLDLNDLIGDAVKLDVRHIEPNTEISKQEIIKLAKPYDLKGKIVFLQTGRDKHYYDETGHDRQYPSAEAVEWLVEQEISCMGVDATGIEVKGLDHQPNHSTLFAKNIPLVENVKDLDKLKSNEFRVFILPINIKGLESSPVRIIAFEDEA